MPRPTPDANSVRSVRVSQSNEIENENAPREHSRNLQRFQSVSVQRMRSHFLIYKQKCGTWIAPHNLGQHVARPSQTKRARERHQQALLCSLPSADGAALIRVEKFEFPLRNVYLIWVAAFRAGRLGELKVKDAFRFSMCCKYYVGRYEHDGHVYVCFTTIQLR